MVYLGCNHLSENINYSEHQVIKNLPENFILFVGSRSKYKTLGLLLKSYSSEQDNKKNDFKIVCFGGGVFQ